MSGDRFDMLRQLFLEAVSLDAADRAAFVERSCAHDPELRDDLESLLETAESTHAEPDRLSDDHIAQVRSGLDRAFEGAALPHASPVTRAEFATIDGEPLGADPEAIGRYRIIRRIASGGMGTVWQAEQDSPKRIVALKTLHLHRSTSALSARLQREWEILGRLQHPGIAQVYDAGLVDMGEGGQPFFAMEFIDGQPLTKYANVQNLDDRQRLELLALACDAVHYAHERGIVHRDLKPDNIMVDGHGRPKVLDFGIARIASESVHDVTTMTRDGQILGTLSYMAPEQMDGNPDGVSARSDVYALGVVGFELLAGRLPHDVTSMSIAGALKVLTSHDPPKLETVDPRFRGDAQTIIGKALEREPERRYASAAAFAADIRRHLAHEPIRARPPSAVYRARKFVRRNRAFVGGTLATMLVLVAGIIVASLLAAAESRQRELATERETLARHNNIKAMRGLIAGAQMFVERGDPFNATRQLQTVAPESRGWAWNHVSLMTPWIIDNSAMPRGDSDQIQTSSFLNRRELFQYSTDGYLGAFDLVTEAPRRITIKGGASPRVFRVARWPSSPDNQIAILTDDNRLVVLDAKAERVRDLKHTWQNDRDATASPKLNHDLTLLSYDVYNNPRLAVYDGHDELFSIDSGLDAGGMQWTESRFLRDRPYLLLGRWGNRFYCVDTDTWQVVSEQSIPGPRHATFGVSSDESLLYTTSNQGVEVRAIPSLDLVDRIAAAYGTAEQIEVSPAVNRLCATFRGDEMLRVFDVESRVLTHEIPIGQATFSRRPYFSPDGRLLRARFPDDDWPWIIDLDEPEDPQITTLEGHETWIYQLAISPDGSLLASAAPLGDILLWDLENNRLLARLPRFVHPSEHNIGVNMDAPLVFSPDSEALLFLEMHSETHKRGLTRIELATGEREWNERADRSAVIDALAAMMPPGEVSQLYHHAAVLNDGRILQGTALVNVDQDGVVVRDIGTAGQKMPDHSDGRIDAGVAADPNGRTFTVGEYLIISVRDAKTFEVLHRIRDGMSDNTWGVAYSRDGSRLALGTEDGRIAVYDTEFFEKLCDIRLPLPHPDARRNHIYTLMWTPDDTRLVTCTDRHIRILESERPFVRDHRIARWNERLGAARAAIRASVDAAALDRLDPAALRIARIEQWAASRTTNEEAPAAE